LLVLTGVKTANDERRSDDSSKMSGDDSGIGGGNISSMSKTSDEAIPTSRVEAVNVASLPSIIGFTIRDRDMYQPTTAIPRSIANPGSDPADKTLTFISSEESSYSTSTVSLLLQNVDGSLDLTLPVTIPSGIQLRIIDSDRNIDTTTRDVIQGAFVNVQIIKDSVGSKNTTIAGSLSDIRFIETQNNTGVFVADLPNNSIPITIGKSDAIGPHYITLTPATIAANPDVTITYRDAQGSPVGPKIFQFTFIIMHTPGSIFIHPAKIDPITRFNLTVADSDLNSSPFRPESFVVIFPASRETANTTTSTANLASFDSSGLGEISLAVNGDPITISSGPLIMTFIETGINTGVFVATNIDIGMFEAAANLKGGDRVTFTYIDNAENPPTHSTATITIQSSSSSPQRYHHDSGDSNSGDNNNTDIIVDAITDKKVYHRGEFVKVSGEVIGLKGKIRKVVLDIYGPNGDAIVLNRHAKVQMDKSNRGSSDDKHLGAFSCKFKVQDSWKYDGRYKVVVVSYDYLHRSSQQVVYFDLKST
jgi:hypothetical protein